MQIRTKIRVPCAHCNKLYHKDFSEWQRNVKLERKSYCSISCASKANLKGNEHYKSPNAYDISKHAGNNKDEFTPFRYLLKTLKNSNRKYSSDLTLEQIKQLWEKQDGKCALTGLPMILKTHSDIGKSSHYKVASVDRIDSLLPYTINNVQLIIRAINFMKNDSSQEETVQFLITLSNLDFSKDRTISSPDLGVGR